MPKNKKLTIPKFTSESEDARWHDRHRLQLESAMARRIKEGSTLTLREAMARAKLRPVTIRLAAEDIDTARKLAAHAQGVYAEIGETLQVHDTAEGGGTDAAFAAEPEVRGRHFRQALLHEPKPGFPASGSERGGHDNRKSAKAD